LVTRFVSDADSLNPVVEEQVTAQYIDANLFPAILDSGFDCEVSYPSFLATSYEVSEDHRTLTYHLRQDGVWEDGQPITAQDYLFSHELYADPVVASPRISFTEGVTVSSPDPATLVLRFDRPLPTEVMLFRTASTFVPKHVLEHADRATLRGNPFNRKPVGAGPFRLAEWKTGEQIVLERNPRSTLLPPALLDRVVFRIIKEETTAIAELKTGGIDMLELTSPDTIPEILTSNPELRLIKRGWRFLDYIGWNLKDPVALQAAVDAGRKLAGGSEDAPVEVDLATVPAHPLWGSTRVRHALTMAINRDALIDGLLTVAGEKLGRPATGTITPELCHDYDDSIAPLPHDPEAARRILAEEGWTDGDGDGTIDKGGRRFEFTLSYNAGNVRRERACVVVQSDLKKVGISAIIKPIEQNVFFDNLRKKDFEASLGGWSAALVVDPRDIWHSGYRYVFNFCSYANPRVDEIIDQAENELDDARRRALWKEMQRLVHEDQPYTFLYWMNQSIMMHRRFRDVECNVLSQYSNLHRWWVPPTERRWTAPGPPAPAPPAG
jgi:peptide/nickel transport system substrate-binding protein